MFCYVVRLSHVPLRLVDISGLKDPDYFLLTPNVKLKSAALAPFPPQCRGQLPCRICICAKCLTAECTAYVHQD